MCKKENRAFQEMLLPAKERLSAKNPETVAKNAGVVYDSAESVFRIKSLNETILVRYPSYDMEPELDEWLVLILLHYLDIADGMPVTTQLVPFGGLKDGVIRGTKFDHTMDQGLSSFLAGKQPEQVLEVCKALDAEIIDSRADICAVFPLFPNYPITINIWFADEEFPASGKMLLSKSADHYLTVEDAVMAGEMMLKRLKEMYACLYAGSAGTPAGTCR